VIHRAQFKVKRRFRTLTGVGAAVPDSRVWQSRPAVKHAFLQTSVLVSVIVSSQDVPPHVVQFCVDDDVYLKFSVATLRDLARSDGQVYLLAVNLINVMD
jgi:hypothetical protein